MSLGKLLAWAKDLLGQLKTMKYCKDCKYREPGDMCGGPLLPKDMVTGRAIVECKTLRHDDNECGKNAHWFEQAPSKEENFRTEQINGMRDSTSFIETKPVYFEPVKKPFWARLLG